MRSIICLCVFCLHDWLIKLFVRKTARNIKKCTKHPTNTMFDGSCRATQTVGKTTCGVRELRETHPGSGNQNSRVNTFNY